MNEKVLRVGDRMRFSGELLTAVQIDYAGDVIVTVIDIREDDDGLKTVVTRVDE
jgi:hypothetical protein